MSAADTLFQARLAHHHDELKWLYMELYRNEDMFAELCDQLYVYYKARNTKLKNRDKKREQDPDWFKKNDMLGMMLYIDNFAGNLKGVREKLDYLRACNVNCVHLMPFLDTPEGRSDGGYAVSDFRKVRPDLGTMEDLAALAEDCHKKNMNVCMDFVMNHTSEDHEWAVKARQGDGEYMSRYFFYDNYAIPAEFEKTVPQVFPTTAPGNFTWLPEIGHYVMTSFYPYQWDLNYGNPRVFNEMMYNFLFLANQGMDIIRIDAVPYIWKQLGTQCRNLPQVHTIVRMMRMICEIVCPSVVLLGEVVMEPEKVVPYFGTVEKPECHMLYNVTTMATTWHTVATRDVRLLKKQMDIVNSLPKQYTFLNYLRCHDDIGWGLDYDTLRGWGMEEVPHKRYLNDFFTGKIEGSVSRGELYNEDPVTQDARFCATTASMCGIESAGFEQDAEKMENAIRQDLMLHAYMLMQSGIPMLYSGDEVAQVNDYTYKENPLKAEDSRYIHRGAFPWELAAQAKDPDTVAGKVYQGLQQLESIRRSQEVFNADADCRTLDTGNNAVLAIARTRGEEQMIGLFNFGDWKTAVGVQAEGSFEDCLSKEKVNPAAVTLEGHGFIWLKKGKS
ncbi:MAG: amylosucrase [Eubacteriales bacterium]|nr:amylosucrase [Eubacteriales bacterium]